MKRVVLLVMLGLLGFANRGRAQDFALKTNFTGWAATSINAAFEAGIGPRTTLETGIYYNPWTFARNKKIRHIVLQPEVRLWNCERFARGFWGVHLLGGAFNIGGLKLPFKALPALRKYRYQGWGVGAGVSYGYDWFLTPRLNIEATVGAGYIHVWYRQYDCVKCGEKLGKGQGNYFGPTKLALNLVYLF